MQIVVDANEARTGLAELLDMSWGDVSVRRLRAGDVAIGACVLVERKTTSDFVASLADGRLFRQARRLVENADRPVVILEGETALPERHVDPGAQRGAMLALAVGFRIPVLQTRNLKETAVLLRHMAAQETRRESRRQRRARLAARHHPPQGLPPSAIEVLCALPGVGRTRAEALGGHVASLHEFSQLSLRDLLAIPGIGPDTAARIMDTLHGHQRDDVAGALSSHSTRTTR